MNKIKEFFKAFYEEFYFKDNGEANDIAIFVTFSIACWLILALVFIAAFCSAGHHLSLSISEIPYAIFAIAVSIFLCFMPLGMLLALLCQFIMWIFKIKSPLKGITSTILSIILIYSCYGAYKTWFPLSSNQILEETFYSEQQDCYIEVVHSRKCPYYRPIFQYKKNRDDFVKRKYTLYCYCVTMGDIQLLDAFSRRNFVDYVFEENYDPAPRKHNIYYGVDNREVTLKRIHGDNLLREYYKTKDLHKVGLELLDGTLQKQGHKHW